MWLNLARRSMSRSMLLILLVALPSLACTQSQSNIAQQVASKPDESKEPPLLCTLKLGEKSIAITEGETVRVDGAFTNPDVTLTFESHRVFSHQGISFEYPRAFTFEADLEDVDNKNWTLSGNDCKIMYFVLNAQLTTVDFAHNMIDQFGQDNCKLDKGHSLKYGDKELSGTRLNATMAGQQFVVDIYSIPANGTKTKLFIVQDNLDDAGNRSGEGKAVIDLLSQSLTLDL